MINSCYHVYKKIVKMFFVGRNSGFLWKFQFSKPFFNNLCVDEKRFCNILFINEYMRVYSAILSLIWYIYELLEHLKNDNFHRRKL